MAVRQENYNFNFYNISANCYRKKRNFRLSRQLYDLALGVAKGVKEKGTVQHNIAVLIYELRRTDDFDEAISSCRSAIDLRKRDRDFLRHAIKTLFLLEVEKCSNNGVVELANSLIEEYLIGTKHLDECISEVTIPIKRRKLQNHFGAPFETKW